MGNGMRTPKRQGGFTLIELTTVIAIVGTLSAVALPRYVDMMRSARVAKMDMARGAVNESARLYHMKWMMAGAPAAAVFDDVPLNGAGYPTDAGIIVAAGIPDSYDTHLAGTIAVDAQHPDCTLVYSPDTGTSVKNYVDDTKC
jgi:MSHA pilin protein MshA